MDTEKFEQLGQYVYQKNRLKSYKIWPHNKRTPCSVEKMAEAGFYWCGNEKEPDSAVCFMCRKALDGWEASDDPWAEHEKHAPQCAFVKLRKPENLMTVEEFCKLYESFCQNTLQTHFKKLKARFLQKAEETREKINRSTVK